ncbi:hypothetical protein DE146DRAFT_782236 [Phaeosphaeria sp. MPI-PUGE-AT-0046c]|nr:hypothetical protein DE146DRAFT_782236 [Phaeosphaeria sp. MPI-PUGE-AT-0046c]
MPNFNWFDQHGLKGRLLAKILRKLLINNHFESLPRFASQSRPQLGRHRRKQLPWMGRTAAGTWFENHQIGNTIYREYSARGRSCTTSTELNGANCWQMAGRAVDILSSDPPPPHYNHRKIEYLCYAKNLIVASGSTSSKQEKACHCFDGFLKESGRTPPTESMRSPRMALKYFKLSDCSNQLLATGSLDRGARCCETTAFFANATTFHDLRHVDVQMLQQLLQGNNEFKHFGKQSHFIRIDD